jgi:hypothetical protein
MNTFQWRNCLLSCLYSVSTAVFNPFDFARFSPRSISFARDTDGPQNTNLLTVPSLRALAAQMRHSKSAASPLIAVLLRNCAGTFSELTQFGQTRRGRYRAPDFWNDRERGIETADSIAEVRAGSTGARSAASFRWRPEAGIRNKYNQIRTIFSSIETAGWRPGFQENAGFGAKINRSAFQDAGTSPLNFWGV